MPDSSKHLAIARRLKGTLEYLILDPEKHSEWITVTAFYRALHLAESVLAENKIEHDRNHVSREKALKRTTSTQHIWKHYRPLWSLSCIARYLAYEDQEYESFSSYIAPAQVLSQVVGHHLRQIEKSTANLLHQDIDSI